VSDPIIRFRAMVRKACARMCNRKDLEKSGDLRLMAPPTEL